MPPERSLGCGAPARTPHADLRAARRRELALIVLAVVLVMVFVALTASVASGHNGELVLLAGAAAALIAAAWLSRAWSAGSRSR